jgi:hypothetical protein
MKADFSLHSLAKWLDTHIAVVFLLWSLWLALLYFGLGPMSYVRIYDNGNSTLPARLALAHASPDGVFSHWNAAALTGTDRLAAGLATESDRLLYLILPGWLAYGLFVWAQRFIAGYFTFRLLRDTLGVGTLASLVAGLGYSLFAQESIQGSTNVALSGFALYDGLATPGLPLVLWILSSLSVQRRVRPYLVAVGLGIMLGLTSHFSMSLFLWPAILSWFLAVSPRRDVRFWCAMMVFGASWLLVETPSLLASLANAPSSHRAAWDMNDPFFGGSMAKVRLAGNLIRDNSLFLFIALMGLVCTRGRDGRLVALIAGITLGLGFVAASPLISSILPGFLAGFQIDRIYLVLPFAVAVAAGVGLGHFPESWRLSLTSGNRERYGLSIRQLAWTGMCGVVIWQSADINRTILNELADGSNYATLFEHPDLQELASKQTLASPFRVATIHSTGILAPEWHAGYAWAYGLETADGYIPLHSQRYQNYWERVIAPVMVRDSDWRDFFHLWGSQVYLFLPRLGSVKNGLVPFADLFKLSLLSLANVRYIVSALPVQDEQLTLLPSQTRDRLLAQGPRRFRDRLADMLRGNYAGSPLYIYENQTALPRAFVAHRVEAYRDPRDVLDAVDHASMNDLSSTAYVLRTDADHWASDQGGIGHDRVTIDSLSADVIKLNIDADRDGVLIIANSFSPYWKARIKGIDTPVFPVDYAFQGVHVEAGVQDLVLEYRPPYAASTLAQHVTALMFSGLRERHP